MRSGFDDGDLFLGLAGIGGFADNFDVGVRLEKSAQLGAGEPLVIDQERFQFRRRKNHTRFDPAGLRLA